MVAQAGDGRGGFRDRTSSLRWVFERLTPAELRKASEVSWPEEDVANLNEQLLKYSLTPLREAPTSEGRL